MDRLRNDNDRLSEELLDLQSRSMRDNLLFYGFPEESAIGDRNTENCVSKVLDFCRDKLEISDAHDIMKIERAHRVGRYVREKN